MEKDEVLTYEEDDIFSDKEHKLIIAMVKRGFETDVIEASRSVGTRGAILMQAKGVSKVQQKFLGFSVNPENTVIMIVVKKELVVPTMKAIYSVVDFKSEARGLVFAMPVSLVARIDDAFDKIDLV